MSITYRELIEQLQGLDPARLNDMVTVYVQGTGEYYPLDDSYPTGVVDQNQSECDILDPGHFYLRI